MFTQMSAVTVPANSNAAPPVSPLARERAGVRTNLCHGVSVTQRPAFCANVTLLPPRVENCHVCGKEVRRGSPGEEGGHAGGYSRSDPLAVGGIGGDCRVAR